MRYLMIGIDPVNKTADATVIELDDITGVATQSNCLSAQVTYEETLETINKYFTDEIIRPASESPYMHICR